MLFKNLDVSEFKVDDTFHQNIRNYSSLKAVLKYKKHPSAMFISQFSYQIFLPRVFIFPVLIKAQ